MTDSLSDTRKNRFDRLLMRGGNSVRVRALSEVRHVLTTAFLLTAMLLTTGLLRAQDKRALPDSISVDSAVTGDVIPPADTVKKSADDSTDQTEESSMPDTVIFRTIPPSETRKYQSDRDFEYANDLRYWGREAPYQPSAFGRFMAKILSSAWFKWFAYCLLGGVLVFAIYKIIAGNRLYLFYKSSKTASAAVTEEHIDIYDEDLETKISNAIGHGDFRTGVRYLFLKTLRGLNDKGLIRFHAQSTNQEYVDQLRGHPPEKDFKFLVYAYEHVWYGERPLSAEQFERLVTAFGDFYKTVDRI